MEARGKGNEDESAANQEQILDQNKDNGDAAAIQQSPTETPSLRSTSNESISIPSNLDAAVDLTGNRGQGSTSDAGWVDTEEERNTLDVASVSQQLFATILSNEQLAQLAGTPPEAVVKVWAGHYRVQTGRYRYKWYNGIMVKADHKYLDDKQKRVFARDEQLLIIFNEFLFVVQALAPAGFGMRLFAHQVASCLRYNLDVDLISRIASIRTHAFGWPGSNTWHGYYVWARCGYDANLDDINPALRIKLLRDAHQPEYAGSQLQSEAEDIYSINDLMLVSGGARWWRENGTDWWGEFVLTEDSRQVRLLRLYIKERKARGDYDYPDEMEQQS